MTHAALVKEAPMPIRTLCAWCAAEGVTTVLQEGEEPASHGICSAHAVIFLRDAPPKVTPAIARAEEKGWDEA